MDKNAPTNNLNLLKWVDEMAQMTQPDKVVWLDGSDEERIRLENEAVATGELLKLNEEKLPGSFYHRTNTNDVARTENLTFICTANKDDAGPNNNWMSPADGYQKASDIFKGSMKGRTMYVVPFSMGPVGSEMSKIGVELTDSIYVALNMRIMTRMGRKVLDVLGEKGEFTKCMHGKADINPDRRLILHFPEDNAIWSVGSGYGGNALLGKKCLALRIASYLANKEGWLAEHMLILGIEKDGRQRYICAAFPSACGKTNLAMLIPPQGLQHKGYKITTVGDDIAWLRQGKDGRLWAINPEAGFFGVAPGTNAKSNPSALDTVQKNTIFTNVLLKDDKTVWWEDGEGEAPASGTDWQGNAWKPGQKDANGKEINGAHPNSRFTAPLTQCPSVSPDWDEPTGVPIDAFIFGGRRARLAPLVYEAKDWDHGVYIGATVASERTAAQYGKQGEVRRDPMAMLPFCGYNMADYFNHWLSIGDKTPKPPKIFHVNWFRRDENNKFMWPGFGENLRVLEWVLDRVEDQGKCVETPIGKVPTTDAIDLSGLDVSKETMEKLLAVNIDDWKTEVESHEPFFKQFGPRLSKRMWKQWDALKERLNKVPAGC
jgi:phosphoenolpyruvate carboxykinase (GTP)